MYPRCCSGGVRNKSYTLPAKPPIPAACFEYTGPVGMVLYLRGAARSLLCWRIFILLGDGGGLIRQAFQRFTSLLGQVLGHQDF